MKLEEHLKRQIAFSRATFGPGARTKGVVDHIHKELLEILAADSHEERVKEWVDVVILGLDGLTRELFATGYGTVGAAEEACWQIQAKQGENEERDWPDWRTAPADKAIEHVRD